MCSVTRQKMTPPSFFLDSSSRHAETETVHTAEGCRRQVFEWAVTQDGAPYEVIDHSPEAIKVSQCMANFFVQQARKSSHSFGNVATEQALLIYNYQPTDTPGGDFVQTYFFEKSFGRVHS